jgi:hypothetical protein
LYRLKKSALPEKFPWKSKSPFWVSRHLFCSTLAAMKCTERSGRSRNRLEAGDFDEAESVFGSNTGRPDSDT